MYEALDWLYDVWFFPTLGLLFLLERVPYFQRSNEIAIVSRWPSNIGLFLFSALAVPILVPAGLYSFAKSNHLGLVSGLDFSLPVKVFLTFLILDLWRYWEHRIYHHFTLLWRCHLVHHSDFELDVTTAERHHPFEVLLALLAMMAIIWLLGLPAEGVGLYLLIANANSLLSHMNIRLPAWIDLPLRLIMVTPRVHAVHHSDLKPETNSNYGVVLTVWDYLFKTYKAPEKAHIPHFGLEYFHLPEDNQLLPVLKQPFMYRPDILYPSRYSIPIQKSALPSAWQSALRVAGAGMVLVLLALWPTFLDMTYHWSHTEAYRYAWLLFPLLTYLFGWHYRDELMSLIPKPSISGLWIVVMGAALWGTSKLINVNVGQHIGLVVIVQGMIVSSFGWKIYKRYLPLWASLFLLVPYGDLLQPLLRIITVKSIESFASLIDLPHFLEGFVVLVGHHSYIVIDECAGLPYFTMATFLGFSFGLLLYRSILKIAALTLIGAFLGILSNVIRVNAIVLIDWLQGSQMALSDHGNFQWFALFLVLGLLFFILNYLDAEKVSFKAADRVGGYSSLGQKNAPIASSVAVFIVVVITLWVPANQHKVSKQTQITLLPETLSEWQPVTAASTWTVDPDTNSEMLKFDYQMEDKRLQIIVVESLEANGKFPLNKLIPEGGKNWHQGDTRHYESCTGNTQCVQLIHIVWLNRQSEQRHVFYTYSVGELNTDSSLLVRAAQTWQMITNSQARSRLIGFVFDEIPSGQDDLAKVYEEVLTTLDSDNT